MTCVDEGLGTTLANGVVVYCVLFGDSATTRVHGVSDVVEVVRYKLMSAHADCENCTIYINDWTLK